MTTDGEIALTDFCVLEIYRFKGSHVHVPTELRYHHVCNDERCCVKL